MPTLQINALDTLFFRDGKPFSMGDDTFAEGVFPPVPSTLYGAIRSIYFSDNLTDLKDDSNIEDPTKNLKIEAIYWGIKGDHYLPLPLDLVSDKSQITEHEVKAQLIDRETSTICTNAKLSNVFFKTAQIDQIETVEDALFSFPKYKQYLNGTKKAFDNLPRINTHRKIENKIGIGINNQTYTSDSENGRLYRVGMTRLIDLVLYVKYSGLELLDKQGFMRLGGEGKIARYQIIEDEKLPTTPNDISSEHFKLVLTTPAFFKNGWYPSFINNNTIRLSAACIGKPISIGGFDLKNKKAKPMFKTVPAGSVYYIETEKGIDMTSIFNQTSISDNLESSEPNQNIKNKQTLTPNNQNQGFGLFQIGKI